MEIIEDSYSPALLLKTFSVTNGRSRVFVKDRNTDNLVWTLPTTLSPE